ncbi:sulfotransferase 6B1 [Petromyzon marinus]|uniref:Sulfotransferase n=1 Tax=Petromyzon marinus TaxID=7757 RepID=A0AAJ7XFG2_PETMA|nr:sulfotransferase 6B1 [Petromyzon marinus]
MNKSTTEQLNEFMAEVAKIPREERLVVMDGLKVPRALVHADTLRRLPDFQARPDDILLLSYPKCGCNWVVRLLMHMVKLAHPELDKDPTSHQAHIPLIEFGPPSKLEGMSAFPSPRVIASHMPRDRVPSSFFANKCKVVLVFREPKDTAVSFYHFYNNNPSLPGVDSWDKFYSMFMEGDVPWGVYLDYIKQWSNHWEADNVLVLTYEELKADLPGELQKMSTFLGLGLSGEQISDVADNGTFSAMKAKAEADNLKFGKVVFRKGEVGDWKNYFSEEQRAELDASYAESLAGTSLANRLNY